MREKPALPEGGAGFQNVLKISHSFFVEKKCE
jgi:hypothetical protein